MSNYFDLLLKSANISESYKRTLSAMFLWLTMYTDQNDATEALNTVRGMLDLKRSVFSLCQKLNQAFILATLYNLDVFLACCCFITYANSWTIDSSCILLMSMINVVARAVKLTNVLTH